MVLRRFLRVFSSHTAHVDALLDTPLVTPGGVLTGEIEIVSHARPITIEKITLRLVIRHGDGSHAEQRIPLVRRSAYERLTLAPRQTQLLPFRYSVPWDTPSTQFIGVENAEWSVVLRTKLVIDRALDESDIDAVQVNPLPAHTAVMDALQRHGYVLLRAEPYQIGEGEVHQLLTLRSTAEPQEQELRIALTADEQMLYMSAEGLRDEDMLNLTFPHTATEIPETLETWITTQAGTPPEEEKIRT